MVCAEGTDAQTSHLDPEAIGAVFAPFVFQSPVLADQRLNSVSPRSGVSWEELAALLTLTAFGYSIEINGSSSMGAGVLEAPTTKVRSYPVFDIRQLKGEQRTQLVSLARAVWSHEPPMDWSKSKVEVGERQKALDRWALERIGTKVTLERLYRDLHEACITRIGLASDKIKKVNKKKTDNIGNVADSIVQQIKPRIKAKNFPEDFMEGPFDASFEIDRKRVRSVQTHTMLGEIDVLFLDATRSKINEATYPVAMAESIVRALLWGRSTFQLASSPEKLHSALTEFIRWARDIEQAISRAIRESALGTGYEDQLRITVFKRLGIHPAVFEATLPSLIVFETDAPAATGRQTGRDRGTHYPSHKS